MCGRYRRRSDKQRIAETFHVGQDLADLYQIFPSLTRLERAGLVKEEVGTPWQAAQANVHAHTFRRSGAERMATQGRADPV